MPAPPPKITRWSDSFAASQPDIFASKPTVTSSWHYFTGALGYWLPNGLNRSKQYRAGMRGIR